MKYHRLIYWIAIFLFAAAMIINATAASFTTVAGASGADAPGDGRASTPKVALDQPLPPELEEMAQTLMTDLGTRFEVGRGYFKLYTADDCAWSYEVMHTCFGNNPAAPYVIPFVPRWPDEFEDLAIKNAFGVALEGYFPNYHLDEREALLIFGYLPPEASYFGIQTYLGNRQGTWNAESDTYKWIAQNASSMLETFFTIVPKDPNRIQIGASLSNAINNVVIERQSGSSWDQLRFFLITPDDTMNQAIRSYLAAKTQPANIFTEPIPGTMNFGLGAPADDFLTLIRYSMPVDGGDAGTASYAWRHNSPLVVLRVRDVDPARPEAEKYPPFVEPETRTATDETDLAASLDKLAYAVSEKWRQPCGDAACSDKTASKDYFSFADWQSTPFNLVGPKCMEIGMNCLGDTQDTVYQVSKPVWLDGGSIYAVIGTVGTQTGNATYTALGLNSNRYKKGFDNIEGGDLIGTAQEFASTVGPDHEDLFVYYIARNCAGLENLTGDNCREVPESLFAGCPDPSGEICELMTLSLRDYIRPDTQRGPDSARTLPPRVIRLHRVMIDTSLKIYMPLISK